MCLLVFRAFVTGVGYYWDYVRLSAGHNPYNLGNDRRLISVSQGEIQVVSGDGRYFYRLQALKPG
jgi:hypothetical protein